MRFCNESNVKRLCNNCNLIVNENKQFEAILNISKREAAKEIGYTLPCFKENKVFKVFNLCGICF